jgi:hypothetical protein
MKINEVLPAEKLAKQFYMLVKAIMSDAQRVSAIYPLRLPASHELNNSDYIEQFSKEMRKLARRDGFKVVILRHVDLNDKEREEIGEMLRFSDSESILKEMDDARSASRKIYLQLQRAKI